MPRLVRQLLTARRLERPFNVQTPCSNLSAVSVKHRHCGLPTARPGLMVPHQSDDLAGSAGQGGQPRQRKCMHCAMARSAWDPRRSRAIRGEIMGRPAVLEASRASPRGALFSRGLGSRHSDKQSGRHRAETLARPLRATGRNLRAKSVDATVGAAQAPGPPDGRAVRASIGSRSLTVGFRPPFQRSG